MLVSQPFSCSHDQHDHCVDAALTAAERLCREQRLRLTPLRRKILTLIWQSHRPVGAYDLLEILQKEGRAAPPTVYRTLDFLLESGLVHRLATRNAYFGCTRPGQDHAGHVLICESCHVLAEIDSADVVRQIDASADAFGFEVRRQTVEVSGLCPRCRQEADHAC
ncbi:MAG: Fur family transcriptional regulator [Desulfuromonas sp.]|nr:MAG: Fur family transcriptional regulator [Desulfuromonas sp.]